MRGHVGSARICRDPLRQFTQNCGRSQDGHTRVVAVSGLDPRLAQVTHPVPEVVVRAVCGESTLVDVREVPIRGSSGAATGEVTRVTGRVTAGGRSNAVSMIRKVVRPLTTGRHAQASRSLNHWAYWLREPLAYQAEVPPAGPGLRAPRCYGVVEDTIYLEDVAGAPAQLEPAAQHLAAWQSSAAAPDVPWLSGHQLEQRIAVSDLDWTSVDADRRAVRIWEARDDLLEELSDIRKVLSHGDFSIGNLLSDGEHTVALDWGTVGMAPAGADLAHLALSSLTDTSPWYLEATDSRLTDDDVLLGYQTTLALTGASRVHWMLANQIDLPDGYLDFIWEHRPPLLRHRYR
jgi:hypothetical protein